MNPAGFSSGDVLLSHGLSPYYHRGCSVSLPCSEWECPHGIALTMRGTAGQTRCDLNPGLGKKGFSPRFFLSFRPVRHRVKHGEKKKYRHATTDSIQNH